MPKKKEWKVLDLFCGAGGMSLGFEAAGARCIGAVDSDASAIETFTRMFGHNNPTIFGGPQEGNVRQLSVERLADSIKESPDIIVGGPPCQGFSKVGRGKNASLMDEDSRIHQGGIRNPGQNLLYRYFLEACQKLQPKAFVMENVPGMRHLMGIDMASRIAREASACGYNVRYFLLNAAWYGVPQQRWRLFFVGLSRKLGTSAIPAPPVRTHIADKTPPDGSGGFSTDPWMISGEAIPSVKEQKLPITVKEAIHDLPYLTGHLQNEVPTDQSLPLRRTPSLWVQQLREWPKVPIPDLVKGNWYRYTPRDFKTFRYMNHGDCYPEALNVAQRLFQESLGELRGQKKTLRMNSKEYKELRSQFIPPYRGDSFDEKWRKLIPDQPSWTVTAHLSKDSYSHIHYSCSQARTITIREAARLQTFPDGFEFFGNYGSRFRQIGNAVPPLLAQAIASQLFSQLESIEAKQ